MAGKEKVTASPITYREEGLAEAQRIVVGARNVQYGGPEENFRRIAIIWGVIKGIEFSDEDVAMMMVALKVARYAANSGFQGDTWIDVMGYGACGYEVGKKFSEQEAPVKNKAE